MSALNLIQEYSSDSDEEAEKSDNESQRNCSVQGITPKLPLPQSILSLKGVLHHEDVLDNPLEHDGRIRSFKHERGNWATLVYINYIPNDDMLLWMKDVISQITETTNLFEEFHASLTRTLILKYHWIDSFVESVKSIIESYESFTMELGNIKLYCNEEKTRTFMGITVQSTNKSLERLTLSLDKLMDEYQLPHFYKDASYHISFSWCLNDQRKTLETLFPSFTLSFYDFLSAHPEQRYVHIDKLKCKIGNKLYNFNLR